MSFVLLTGLVLLSNIVYGARQVKKGPCDNTRECIRYDFTGADRMLCFGYYACKGATMGSTSKAVCSGANSCTRGKFTTNVASILCNGFKACQRGRAMINNAKISCNGLKSCNDVVGGLNAPVILCDGDIACTNFKSKKNSLLALNLNAVGAGDDSLLYCNGNQVCRDTQQRSDGLIYCDGDGACKESRMQGDSIECQGKRACKDAIMQPNGVAEFTSLKCHGWFGCAGAQVIMAKEILAYGFNAMANAVIETRGMPEFTLKAYGFRALAGASIDCKGSICNIDCKGNACKGVPISVAKSSTLNLTPKECDPNDAGFLLNKKDPSTGVGSKVQGINCPAVLYARADETDEQLNARMQSYVAAYQQTEEYQEYLEIEDIAQQESDLYIDERLRDYEMENEYDDDEDDELFEQENNQYLFGDNVSLQTQIASSLITSNLLTAIATFVLTGGLISFIFNKYRNGYKSLA